MRRLLRRPDRSTLVIGTDLQGHLGDFRALEALNFRDFFEGTLLGPLLWSRCATDAEAARSLDALGACGLASSSACSTRPLLREVSLRLEWEGDHPAPPPRGAAPAHWLS